MNKEEQILKGQALNIAGKHLQTLQGFKEMTPKQKAKMLSELAKEYYQQLKKDNYFEW